MLFAVPDDSRLEIIRLLDLVRRRLTASADSDWAVSVPETAASIVAREIKSLEMNKTFVDRRELETLFLPTGDIQEIAISNGWAEEFVALTEQLDFALRHLR